MKPIKEKDKLIDSVELSEKFGIKRSTIYTMVRENRIPFIRLGKKFVRFNEHDILEWLKSKKVAERNKNV